MNLRQKETALIENAQLKKDKQMLEKKLSDLMIMLENKMGLMIDKLNEIKDKPIIIQQVKNSKEVEKIEFIKKDDPGYIPTPDHSDLKMNVQDLKKTRKKTNIEDSLLKLDKLQENNKK